MKTYSLAIAWTWEYDDDFVSCLKEECLRQHVTALEITSATLPTAVRELEHGELRIQALYDRASDDEEAFFSVVGLLQQHTAYIINPHQHLASARDKATMHLELISAGLQVPFTIIISPYNHRQEVMLSLSELEMLGRPFIIKPANTTGGGIGVVVGAETLKDIIDSRQHHKNDKYLLQETIYPAVIDGRRAWFRILYAFGEIFPCWWDDRTHVYEELLPKDEEYFQLGVLRGMMRTIQSVCKLDFFSSEVALAPDGRMVVIDYVNEICDMRLQSKHADGVPDTIVRKIAAVLVANVKTTLNGSATELPAIEPAVVATTKRMSKKRSSSPTQQP